jgi:hypothetical protein
MKTYLIIGPKKTLVLSAVFVRSGACAKVKLSQAQMEFLTEHESEKDMWLYLTSIARSAFYQASGNLTGKGVHFSKESAAFFIRHSQIFPSICQCYADAAKDLARQTRALRLLWSSSRPA